jgi:outer membrane lipoprotein-sorting protein
MNRSLLRTNVIIAAALLAAIASPCLAAADLPKAETILDKYIEATGGKAAYQKLHSQIESGIFEMSAAGIKGAVTSYRAEPDLAYTEIVLEGIGKITDGSDGKVAWANSAMQGPHVKEGAERAQAMQTTRFNGELHWRETYKTAETTGVEAVDGKDCYKVVLTPAEGPAVTHFYDKDSGLLTKISLITQTPMGEVPADSFPSDYRKEGDILLPHKVRQSVAGQEFTITIDTVKLNPEIPKTRFDLPDEIKALVNKK